MFIRFCAAVCDICVHVISAEEDALWRFGIVVL